MPMTAFFLELMKEIGLFAILQEVLKKRAEAILTPKGFNDNALWLAAFSCLSQKEMADISDALNNHMTEKERINFRLMIAIAQSLTSKKGEPEVEGFGTKILRGYLRHFERVEAHSLLILPPGYSRECTVDIPAMATQMKSDMENPENPLIIIVNGFKKFFVFGIGFSQEGHEQVMNILEQVLSDFADVAETAQKKFSDRLKKFKEKHPKRRY